jgi:predicted RNA methylase
LHSKVGIVLSPRAGLGQVFTPAALADLTLALAVEGMDPRARLLDPACGDGIFLARARAAGLSAAGVDIDPRCVELARRHSGDVRRADFLAMPAPDPLVDAVIGNPPYVRQERLSDKSAFAKLALPGRSDLALAFVARSLEMVRPGGRVSLVVSAALLDAAYGASLTRLLAAAGARVRAVVASPRERWFPDAAVNSVILLLERVAEPVPIVAARLRVPVADARVTGLGDLARVAEVRQVPPGAPLMPALRAPPVWFAAASSQGPGGALVPLSELARVRRGVTSGANQLFYLGRADTRGIEPRFLAPLLRSPRGIDRIPLDAAALPALAFVHPGPLEELPAGARAWVDAHQHLAARPSLEARRRWWSLPARPARLFLTKAYSARFVQPLASAPVIGDQRLYAVVPRRGVPVGLLAAALNGTLAALALESLGRASLGEGALEVSVGDAAALPVVDVRRLDARAVQAAFAPLLARRVGDVFAEAGRPDRLRLDRALAAPFPRLRPLVDELAPALAATVETRLARARTFA